MAEKSIEEKARKIASQRSEVGKEFEQMQAAQNQLLEIQAAQKQNLMERRVMANSQAEQNQVLAQAAEVGAQSVAGNMQLNQATQQTMGRYGLSQPKTTSQVKQRQSEVVTRQNVTIHNNTTNITNNTVPANIGGPIQGRPVQFKQPADGGMGRFRSWLQQTFARQEDAAKKRDREYQRRETALTKSSNKMMRKLEDFSKDITKRLDPRNVGRTIGGQLRTILGVLGIGLLAKNFGKVLDWIFGAQKKVENEYIPNIKNFFAWVKGDENANEPGFITKLTEGIGNAFGKVIFGQDYDGSNIGGVIKEKGLVGALKDLFTDTWKKFSGELSKRNQMALSVIDPGSWKDLLHPGEAVKKLLENLTNYFSVLLTGDKAMVKLQEEEVGEKAAADGHGTTKADRDATFQKKEEVATTRASAASGKRDRNSSGGDWSATAGRYELGRTYGKDNRAIEETEDYRIPADLISSDNGKLTGSIGSTIAAARQIVSDYTYGASKGNINNARVSNNFKELARIAENYESVTIPVSFVNNSRTGNLIKSGKLDQEIKDRHIVLLGNSGVRVFEIDRPKSDAVLLSSKYSKLFKDFAKENGLTVSTSKKNTINIVSYLSNFITQEGYMLGPDGKLVDNKQQSTVKKSSSDQKVYKLLNKLNGFPLYIRMLVYQNWLKPGDIIIRELSANEVANLMLVDKEGLKAIYYKGYLSDEQRKKIKQEDVDFAITRSNVQTIDDTLVEIAKSKGNKKFSRDLFPESLVDDPAKAKAQAAAAANASNNTPGVNATAATPAEGDIVVGESGSVQMTPASTGTTTPGGTTGGSTATTPTSTNANPGAGGGATTGSGEGSSGSVPTIRYQETKASGGTGKAARGCGGNSALISAFIPVPYHSGHRKSKVSKITIHHMAGVNSIENCVKGWLSPKRESKGSSNYGIGSDGRIGLFVIEDYRAWTSSSPANDDVAVTIEVSNNKRGEDKSEKGWTIDMNVVYPQLIRLCADICWRRGISNLHYTGDKTGSLTVHRLFAATACPGEHLMQLIKSGQLERDVNNLLNDPNFQANVQKGQEFSQPASSKASSGAAIVQASTGGGSSDPDGGETVKGTFGDFLSSAGDIIKGAIGGLSHKISDGASWAADKIGGAMDFEASMTGGVSGVKRTATERYMAAKYMNSQYAGFNNSYAVPSSIQAGSKLNRNEWWADFFDKDGNLKIKESDVSPQILSQLHEIQGELKKGNDLDELHLQIAADGLDAEMYHSATENQNQRRLINALLVSNPNESRAQSMTGDNA